MPIRNLHWYSQNENRTYPIAETASSISDAGDRLASNVIVDLKLVWPTTLGSTAFIAGVTVSTKFVTVTIQASDNEETANSLTPLAVIAVANPREDIAYKLEPQETGVGGWIVFGSGIRTSFSGRFSSPSQTRLARRASRAYKPLPVKSLSLENARDVLTGFVYLKAASPLVITQEDREIQGVIRECVVFSLDNGASKSSGNTIAPSGGNSVTSIMEEFSGPCGKRPESRTCGDPQPVEFIDVVGPDCDGVITLEFQGCASVTQLTDPCGIAIDCSLGLDQACQPLNLPDEDGTLPNDKTPLSIPGIDDPVDPDDNLSESYTPNDLPYVECFKDGNADDFETRLGSWNLTVEGSDAWKICPGNSVSGSISLANDYAYESQSAAGRNVTIWNGNDLSCLRREFQTNTIILDGPAGAKHNAGLLFNYRESTTVSGQYVYWIAEIDYEAGQVRIARFNGLILQPLISLNHPGIRKERWYRINVKTTPGTGNEVDIVASFESLEDNSMDVTIGPLTVMNFYPSDGKPGFTTNKSWSRFSYLSVAEYV